MVGSDSSDEDSGGGEDGNEGAGGGAGEGTAGEAQAPPQPGADAAQASDGAWVRAVRADSPAARAGVTPGSTLVAVDGEQAWVFVGRGGPSRGGS